MAVDRVSIERALVGAGCVAPAEEGEALIRAAAGDPARRASMLARRVDGEPLPWITGWSRFWTLDVRITAGVYVPRWQTEPLARTAASLLPPEGVAIDLCTGAGAIAMVLATAAPMARVIATDGDPLAPACARRNGADARAGGGAEPLPASLEGSADVIT